MGKIEIVELENAPDRLAYQDTLDYQRDITNWLLKFVVFGNSLIRALKEMKGLFSDTNNLSEVIKKVQEQIQKDKNETKDYLKQTKDILDKAKSAVLPEEATYNFEQIDEYYKSLLRLSIQNANENLVINEKLERLKLNLRS